MNPKSTSSEPLGSGRRQGPPPGRWQCGYRIADLFGPAERAAPFEGGSYVTLRLTSSMYHRSHAPHDGTVEHVSDISGDTWNVNPIALERVERLFCRNERAVIRMRLADGTPLALVPVAAILVASIRLHCLDVRLHLRWPGPPPAAAAAIATHASPAPPVTPP